MKKYLFLILLIILFSCSKDVFAFSKTYDYNYEVKKLTKDNDGNITISGWGILNAGVNDKSNSYGENCNGATSSPCLDDRKNYGSGSNSSICTGNSNNKYLYTLYLVPVNGNNSYNLNSKEKIKQISGSGTDLTTIMCRKHGNNSCDVQKSPCYENVGWSFSFNDSLLEKAKYKNGYIFYLEIYSTGAKKTVGFPLTIYKDRIDQGFGEYKYTSGSMKVTVIAFNGYYRDCANGSCFTKSGKKEFKNGVTYDVLGIDHDEQTYFKVGSSLFIPSSWVAPPKDDFVIFTPQTEDKDVNSCQDTTTLQKSDSKTIESCSGMATFSGSNYSGCTVNNYDYYTIKCEESDFVAKLSINNIEPSIKEFSLSNGAGFEATANLGTKFVCKYIFDVNKFKTNYDNVVYNLNYYDANDPEYYENYNIKLELDKVLQNYINQTKNLANWNSGYDITKAVATLKVANKTKNLIVESSNQEKIDLNNDNKKENSFCLINHTKKVSIGGKNYNINYDVTCGQFLKANYSLPKTCLSMKTGDIEECNPSKAQIDGGKKYYIDMSSSSGDIQLKITKLGNDGKWDVTLSDCAYNVPTTSILKKQVKFRQIDLTDPFLQTYGTGRTIGENYSNYRYNFVNIIKSDIWEKNPNFKYSMSKVNIQNIKSNTNEEGVSSYLGRVCYFTNNKYICDFTRNNNSTGKDWFTNFQINE